MSCLFVLVVALVLASKIQKPSTRTKTTITKGSALDIAGSHHYRLPSSWAVCDEKPAASKKALTAVTKATRSNPRFKPHNGLTTGSTLDIPAQHENHDDSVKQILVMPAMIGQGAPH
jgi:hypothetical protein